MLLGASVLTIFELLDLLFYNSIKKYCLGKEKHVNTGDTPYVENGGKSVDNSEKLYDPVDPLTRTHAI